MRQATDTEILADVPLEARGYGLGQRALDDLRERAAELVDWEKRRREKLNQAEISSLKVRYNSSLERRRELKEILRLAPPESLQSFRRGRWFHWFVAVVLIIAGVFFAHLTLVPFGLGWEAWAYSLGAALVAAFWTEKTLEKMNSGWLIRSICIVALLSSLGGLLVMALLRGDILSFQLSTSLAIDFQSPESGASFYADAIWKLQLLMGLLTIGMELGSGMAMFEARRLNPSLHEQAVQARRELQELESEMAGTIHRVTYLQNEAEISEAAFFRDICLGMLEGMKRNGIVHFMLVLGLLFSMLPTAASAQFASGKKQGEASSSSVHVVIALDLSKSVATAGYEGKTDYEKNMEAACQLIPALAPGTRLTVLAITDQSFAQPYILLSRQVPNDKGPLLFHNKVEIAKSQIAVELREGIQSLGPDFLYTDILGTLLVSAEMFKQSPEARKVLIVFSDMRQATKEIDLEKPSAIAVEDALRRVERATLVAELSGVEVYALGVHGAGKPLTYRNSLRDFWQAYFKKAGADLRAYSVLREARALFQEAGASAH